MDKNKAKTKRRKRRHISLRKRVIGTPERPRLCVNKTLKHMHVQIIDDLAGRTLVSASTQEKSLGLSNTGNVAAASAVGKALAEKAKEAGIDAVVFDRAGYRYHGRVKALADAVRKSGLKV